MRKILATLALPLAALLMASLFGLATAPAADAAKAPPPPEPELTATIVEKVVQKQPTVFVRGTWRYSSSAKQKARTIVIERSDGVEIARIHNAKKTSPWFDRAPILDAPVSYQARLIVDGVEQPWGQAIELVPEVQYLAPLPCEPSAATTVFDAANTARVENGLAPLAFNEQLAAAADSIARWNAEYWRDALVDDEEPGLSHERDGEFVVASGFPGQAGANLAGRFWSPTAIVPAWMTSQQHHDFIVDPGHTGAAAGCSIVRVVEDGNVQDTQIIAWVAGS